MQTSFLNFFDNGESQVTQIKKRVRYYSSNTFLLKWWGQIDKVRTFLLQLKPKILNWRELNPSKKFTMEIFKLIVNSIQ